MPTQQIQPLPPMTDVTSSDNVPALVRRKMGQPAPVVKVAGARRPAALRGKIKQATETSTNARGLKREAAYEALPVRPTKKSRGRAPGATNYTDDDLEALMDIMDEIIPTGEKAENSVAANFKEWAIANERPERDVKSLKKKFNALVRTEKPTGEGECPSYIDRAHHLYDLMDEKYMTQDVDDNDVIELSDSDDATTYDKIFGKKTKNVIIKQEPGEANVAMTVSRRSQAATLPRPGKNTGNEFLKTISNALDPRIQASLAEDRTTRSIQTTQILGLTTQLRDAQATIETLRTRISDLERERNDANRKLDLQEMKALIHGVVPTPRRAPRRQEVYYKDGGRATRWVDSDESDHRGDSPTTKRITLENTPERENPKTTFE